MPTTKCPLCSSSIVGDEKSPAVSCPLCGTRVAGETPMEASTTSSIAPDPLLGRTFGGCRVHGLIGEGGMGSVYKAWQQSLETWVALKTIRPDRGDAPLVVQRFEREAKITARFNSPYVIKIKDTGVHEGIHYLVMEYVEGVDLATYYPQQPNGVLSPEQALTFLENAATGLLEAEHLGIVHRDIKPANLLVTIKKGVPEVVRIADFGVLRDTNLDPLATSATARISPLVGTPMFMSPEQLRLDPIDHRSDMYSLGASLYLMLTAMPPATGHTLEKLRASKLAQKQLSPGRARPELEIPRRLSAIVERMTALAPADRYASFADVLADVEKARRPAASRIARASAIAAPVLLVAAIVLAIQLGGGKGAGSDPETQRAAAQTQLRAKQSLAGDRTALEGVLARVRELESQISGNALAQPRPESKAVAARLAALTAALAIDRQFFDEVDQAAVAIGRADFTGPYSDLIDKLPKEPDLRDRERELAECRERWEAIAALAAQLQKLTDDVAKAERPHAELERAVIEARSDAAAHRVDSMLEPLQQLEQALTSKLESRRQAIDAASERLGSDAAAAELTQAVAMAAEPREFLTAALRERVLRLEADVEARQRVLAAIDELEDSVLALPFDRLDTRIDAIDRACTLPAEHSRELENWAGKQRVALVQGLLDGHEGAAVSAARECIEREQSASPPSTPEEKGGRLQQVRSVAAGLQVLAGHRQLPGELLACQQQLRDFEDKLAASVIVVLPADWPTWAKKQWPIGYAPPAGLKAGGAGRRFVWPKAAEREFVLVDGDGVTPPFLIERTLVTSKAAEAYFLKAGSHPTQKGWDQADDKPAGLLTLPEVEGFAARSLDGIQFVLPTRQQLELAAGAVVGPDGLRELVRATDGAVFAGNEPLDPRWEGDRKVGFRCVLQLERAK